jgi:hypothetical protein
VKITITTAGKTVVNYTVNVLVLEKTVGSYGTYDGGGAKGQATLTIPSTGKISGKYLADGLTWTLSAPYFDSFDDGTKMYTATLEAKCGKDVVPLFLSAWRDARGIDNARVADGDGNEIATLYKDADWKTGISPWKSIAKDFAAAPEITYAATDSVAGPGFVTLKFSNNGSVTVKGEFSGYKASGSAPLLPTCLIWEFMNHDATSTAVVYVYLPPKAGKFAGHVKAVQLQWDGLRFNDVTP